MQKKVIAVLLIIVFSVVFGTSTPGSFFSGDINMIDEGQFSAWANHMSHGKLLFKDIYITYGPLSVYPLFLLFETFGASAFLVRLYLTLGGTLGILVSFFLMKELKLKKWITALLICMFLLIPVFNIRESVGLWGLYLLMRSHNRKSLKLTFLAGIIASVSFLVSPDFGTFLLIVAYFHFLVMAMTTSKLGNSIKPFGLFVLGSGIVILGFCLLAFSGNWLKEYIFGTYDIVTSISGINVPNGMNFPNPISAFLNDGLIGFIKFLPSHSMLLYWSLCVYFAAAFYISLNLIRRKIREQEYAFVLLFIFGILVYTILLTRHGAGHYFYTLPANLMICGYFLTKVFSIRGKKTVVVRIVVALILIYFVRILYLNNPMIRKAINPYTYMSQRSINPDRVGFLNISNSQKRKIIFFQKFVDKNTEKQDYIFLFNDEPSIYMLVDRVNPTMFDLPFIGNTLSKRQDIVSSLRRNSPKYIFIDMDVWAIDGISNFRRLPEVYTYIGKNYSYVATIENVKILKLK